MFDIILSKVDHKQEGKMAVTITINPILPFLHTTRSFYSLRGSLCERKQSIWRPILLNER